MYHDINKLLMIQEIGNQQGCNLNEKQVQVILTGTFGDGCIVLQKSGTSYYKTNSINKEYIDYKKELLGDIFSCQYENINQGFKNNTIYTLTTKHLLEITKIHALSIEEKLKKLNDLGLALWFYDDGSLHKKFDFFNLNTHIFSEEIQQDLFIPFFNNLGMYPKILKDKKKDGREFSYLYFGKHFGTFEIMQILQKYPIECFKYKLWSSETIQKWSKLKAELKSRDIEVSPRKFTNILNGISSI